MFFLPISALKNLVAKTGQFGSLSLLTLTTALHRRPTLVGVVQWYLSSSAATVLPYQ